MPHSRPQTWRTRVAFDLSGMGDPTNSYATASHTQDHLTTQAPLLLQSRHTFWRITFYHLAYIYQFKS